MEHEAAIRLGVFLSLFIALAMVEAWAPRRERVQTRQKRWVTNWAIVILDTITLRLLASALPLLAVGAAIDAQSNGFGLMNRFDLSLWITVPLTVLIFDS